ncbi:MAG: PSD1 domain-containing protein [Bryobacterales bacterium]|nr:PSD1 domain-containing protein [Bryobacterales bacterium]
MDLCRVLPLIGLALLPSPWLRGEVSFNRDVRPIMSDTCFQCHGPDSSSRMAGLRLDLRDAATKPAGSGKTPIVPGDPDRSEIVQRIFATNARVMPPKHAHKDLTGVQKETIRRWVAEGAKYEEHWAYQPVRRPEPPAQGHPVDAFIQARLRREGLSAAREADRRTLLRRVALDLTGLPPTPAEVDAFEKDRAPGAYERVVDRLLASPRFAEKQAQHWLDAVRYADTAGFHGDNPIPAWPYRDYVLRAFHQNKPFDQFTREQIAGDLLGGDNLEPHVASAYNRVTRMSAEGGVQDKEYLAKYAADRVRTASNVWLGSTMGCAECHDHKFDPFTARDFYAFKAFFADIEETGLVRDRGSDAWGVKILVPDEAQKRKRSELKALVEAAREALETQTTALAERQAAWERKTLAAAESGALAWKFQRPVGARALNGTVLDIYNDEPVTSMFDSGGSLVTETKPGNGMVIASGPNPDNDIYEVEIRPGAGRWTALCIETSPDESLPALRLARGSDRVIVTGVDVLAPGAVALDFATTNSTMPPREYPALAAIDGDPSTAWGVISHSENRQPALAVRFAQPLSTTADQVITVRIRQESEFRQAAIGRFRIALSSAAATWPGTVGAEKGLPDAVLKALAKPAAERSEAEKTTVRQHFQRAAPELDAYATHLARTEATLGLFEATLPEVIVTRATEPRETRILARGNWMDDSGEIVDPAVPAFLGKLNSTGRATRLDLANWLVSPENPLTARVQVNRWWRQFFGTGLAKVLDDFGSQGEAPSHPELLDWLAAEFQDGWDMKRIIRTIVTSHAYRQSSQPSPEAQAKDPDNRLLAYQNRFRVDAENVRDIILSVSGLLEERFGGPSVRPYQPEGYLAALNFPKRAYPTSRGADLYRRGVYTHWQRTFLHPNLLTFDASSREECTVNRVNSNTPLQALVLLNDPAYVEASRVFAERAVRDGGASPGQRIDWAFHQALGRAAKADERSVLSELYRKNRARFQAQPRLARELAQAGEAPLAANLDEVEVAAMTTVTRAILNLHETITRN